MFWQRDKQVIDNFTSLRWRLGISYSIMAVVVTALLAGMAVQTAMTISMSAQKEQALSAITGVATAFADSLGSSLDPAQTAKQLGLAANGTGTGVPKDVLAQLGTRFYRPATARDRSSGGAGLGLSIVKEVLRLHQGRLEFASPPGQGLIVKLIIPELTPHPKL